MKNKLSYLFIAILLIIGNIFSTNIVLAHSSCNNWTNGPNCVYAPYTGQYTFIYQYGYYWTDSKYMKWNNNGANDIKNSGHRYTQDNTDGTNASSEHFSATGNWGTNFPNPVYDRDNDTWLYNSTYEEAEITANYANFPTPNVNYWTSFQWTRPYYGSGHMYFTSQLSNYTWWMREWNTMHYDLLLDQYYDSGNSANAYPGSSDRSLVRHDEDDSAKPANNAKTETELYDYTINRRNSLSEVNINVDFKLNAWGDQEKYINENFLRAEELINNKNHDQIQSVITFNEPISQEMLEELIDKYGLEISSFKTRLLDEKNDIVTVGGVVMDNEVNVDKVVGEVLLPERFPEKSFSLLGITSVEVMVNSSDYTSLNQEARIYLIDIMPTWIKINTQNEINKMNLIPGTPVDVNVNDLYWNKEKVN